MIEVRQIDMAETVIRRHRLHAILETPAATISVVQHNLTTTAPTPIAIARKISAHHQTSVSVLQVRPLHAFHPPRPINTAIRLASSVENVAGTIVAAEEDSAGADVEDAAGQPIRGT